VLQRLALVARALGASRGVLTRHVATSVQDVMRYPFLSVLLYRGSFKQLKFEGAGDMYYATGALAYRGAWHDGAIHGHGSLV